MTNESLGKSKNGKEIFLKDLWPTNNEISETLKACLTPEMFKERYKEIYKGDDNWNSINSSQDTTYNWNDTSTYIKHPPFFDEENDFMIKDIKDARILALLGDSVTTDHISPAGSIKEDSPAGLYLTQRQINLKNFNSYGSRREITKL